MNNGMNRRVFLAGTTAMLAPTLGLRPLKGFLETESDEPQLQVTLEPDQTVAVIPSNFTGLGYEISSVARIDLLNTCNTTYVQLVRTLGKHGVIRVGGNTSDYASYSATGRSISSPEGSVVNQVVLNDLGIFLDAVGWQLILGSEPR